MPAGLAIYLEGLQATKISMSENGGIAGSARPFRFGGSDARPILTLGNLTRFALAQVSCLYPFALEGDSFEWVLFADRLYEAPPNDNANSFMNRAS